jgi:hypothetical protein
MGARIDKTESSTGVVRGTLLADIAQASWNHMRAVGIDSAGKTVLGAGQSGIVGIVIVDRTNYRAGSRCDIFKLGEVILTNDTAGNDLLAAGTRMTANTTTGVITSAAASGTQIAVGYTEATDRFIIQGLG